MQHLFYIKSAWSDCDIFAIDLTY